MQEEEKKLPIVKNKRGCFSGCCWVVVALFLIGFFVCQAVKYGV